MTSPSESSPLAGVRVAVFESRMAGPTADMIAKYGGVPLSAPALREVPLGEGPEVNTFAKKLTAGEFDVVIFETGVGAGTWPRRSSADAAQTWLEALARTKVVDAAPNRRRRCASCAYGGPARTAPNTWHETLAALDTHLPVAGLRVAVQEYGKPNIELIAGLEIAGRQSPACQSIAGTYPKTSGRCVRRIGEIAQGQGGHRPLHVGTASRAPLQDCCRRGTRSGPTHRFRHLHYCRVDRSHDVGNPPRTQLAGRYRAGTPQAGPPHRGRRRRLARHGQGRIDLS